MENGFIGGKKRCRRMYVQYLRVIPCILTLGILTSCGGNAEKEEEIGISTVAYTEEAAEMEQWDTGDLWKKAYIDYIESCNQREIDSFDLIYLDDVYSILDGELVQVAKGDYDILSWEEAGEDGEEVPVCPVSSKPWHTAG